MWEEKESEKLKKEIISIQKKIPSMMQYFRHSINLEKEVSTIREMFKGLSFEESIIRLTQLVCFRKYDDIKIEVINGEGNFIERVFGETIINEEGNPIVKLEPLDVKNPSKNKWQLDDHIRHRMAFLEGIDGDIVLKIAINVIKESFDMEKESFDFITKDNAIIPDGRSETISFALKAFFNNYKYESLHILAPQMENIFRNIAEKLGGLVHKTNKDMTIEVKSLNLIFEIPELKAGYDNDILFIFEALLSKRSGANIRNNITHGVTNPKEVEKGIYTFFVCALINLLVRSSGYCLDIYSKSDKLKNETDFSKKPEDKEK